MGRLGFLITRCMVRFILKEKNDMNRNQKFTMPEVLFFASIFLILTALTLAFVFLLVDAPLILLGVVVLLTIFVHRTIDENGNNIYSLGPVRIGLIKK